MTRVATESYGTMAGDGGSAQLEVRASWTPTDAPELAAHVEAWGELLCTAGGLEPVPDGVAVMPSRRGQRGSGRSDAGHAQPRHTRRRRVAPEPEVALLTLADGLPPVIDTDEALVA